VRDVRMVQRGERFCFALEPREALRGVGEHIRENFDRHIPIQLPVPGAIDLAHPAGAEGGEDLVRAEASTGLKGHGRM
jgi:hypothetical protein